MSTTLGNRWYPCRHQNARLPQEAGTFDRQCDTCKTRYTLTVTPAEYVSERCNQPVLIARWTRIADSDQSTQGPSTPMSHPVAPMSHLVGTGFPQANPVRVGHG